LEISQVAAHWCKLDLSLEEEEAFIEVSQLPITGGDDMVGAGSSGYWRDFYCFFRWGEIKRFKLEVSLMEKWQLGRKE